MLSPAYNESSHNALGYLITRILDSGLGIKKEKNHDLFKLSRTKLRTANFFQMVLALG
jgi:hypothetical protein